MGKRLESIGRPIDADVEKNGAKEIRWDNDSKDSYDFLFDDYEIEALREEDLASQEKDDESDAIKKLVIESEMPEPDESLWDATALGRATINEPTEAKKLADGQDKNIEPISKEKFQEIADDLDPADLEMQKKLEDEIAELEGKF